MEPTYSAPHLGFTYASITDPDAVARNRRGELTPLQERLLRRFAVHEGRWTTAMGLLGVVGVMAFVTLVARNLWPMLAAGAAPSTVWLPSAMIVAVGLAAEAALLSTTLRSWRRMRQLEEDIAARQIAIGEGEVAWGRGPYSIKMYVAQIDGRALRTPAYSLQLPPGRYRFAYLATSRWLLSAEPLAAPAEPLAAPVAAAPQEELEVLARQHGFTLDDLEANRRGELSARQRRGLIGAGLGLAAAALLAGLATGALTLGMALPGAVGGLALPLEPGGLILAIAGWAGLALLIGAARRSLDAAMAQPPLRSLSGPLTVRFERGYRSTRAFYRIGGKECELSNRMLLRQAYNSVIERRAYRLYYLARTRTLLSLEPLEARA